MAYLIDKSFIEASEDAISMAISLVMLAILFLSPLTANFNLLS